MELLKFKVYKRELTAILAVFTTLVLLIMASFIPPAVKVYGKGIVSISTNFSMSPSTEKVEIVTLRTENNKTYDLGGGKQVLDCSIGAVHYKDTEGNWQDIDADYSELDSGDFTARFTKLPYLARMSDNSYRRIYPDRNDLSYWIDIGKPFPNMGKPVKEGGLWTWNYPNATLRLRVSGSILKLSFILKNDSAPTIISFPFAVEGITREGRLLLHDGKVVAELRRPFAIDAEGTERDVEVSFDGGKVTLNLDTAGLVFPIDIDPTLDLQVGASADDAFQLTDNSVVLTGTYIYVDDTTEHAGNRFVNVTVPAGATIGVAKFSIYISSAAYDEPQHQLRGELSVNATQFTTATNNIDARPRTTATVQWNSAALGAATDEEWQWGAPAGNSTGGADISSIIQEIIDQVGWVSGNALVLIYEQHTLDAARDLSQRTYDNGSLAAKLHIEYTTGGESSISNAPDSRAFGVVKENSTYWANSGNTTTPSNPLSECYFAVTNNGTGAVDITIHSSNFTSTGTGWTLGEPALNVVKLTAFKNGDNITSDGVVLTNTPQAFISALAEDASEKWEFSLETGTFGDGELNSCNITLTASTP